MTQTVWLNGVYLARSEARISPFDRGFLLGDSVYEVTAVYGGRLIDMERHLDRLQRSLTELRFPVLPDRQELEAMHRRLIADNAVKEGLVYLQVSRGAYGERNFLPPTDDKVRLTCFAFAESKALVDTPASRGGIRAITLPDIRWGRRDIKTTQLLASVLAKGEAKARDAQDAWLVAPDGLVNEGASSNAWIVNRDGDVLTRPLSNDILPGVTRHGLMDLLSAQGRKVVERAFSVDEAYGATEAFQTGAGALVWPVVAIDGRTIGSGQPGSVTRAIQKLYYQAAGVDVARAAPWVLGAA
ncbi:MAG: D-amino-acid transaminase [Hyphomonadaceae bacterium]